MQRRLTAAEYRASLGKGKKRNKYGAKRTKGRDGRTYDSKAEARVADELYHKKQAGEIEDYFPQMRVAFSSEITWRCDFMVVSYSCKDSWGVDVCRVRFIEVKSRATEKAQRWRDIQKLLKKEKPWIWERLEVRVS